MRYLAIILLTAYSFTAFSQHSDPGIHTKQLSVFQDSLKKFSYQIINNENQTERYDYNYKFIKTLVEALKTRQSFNYNFDSLNTISLLKSPDQRFRIFSWHVMNDNGSYRYYGSIQVNNPDGKLQLFPLVDYTDRIQNPQDTVTSNEQWYGAQYYKIIPVTYNVRTPYYVLLGWKGSTVRSTKKVIDILYFKDGKAYFGMPVFDGNKETAGNKRIIFEYSRQVSMMLDYLPKEGKIVFDHLAPPDPKMEGEYNMYGPDMSYDGYKLLNGRWRYQTDLVLKNPPSDKDADFNDPKNPKKMTKRVF